MHNGGPGRRALPPTSPLPSHLLPTEQVIQLFPPLLSIHPPIPPIKHTLSPPELMPMVYGRPG
ncbi:hypothetical protein TIFTF001_028729 [Ficus carica]|uniref:Uncharacterized protein n=1 Tax=Ficus carica TaxID=3494 RepID=A0AA88J1X4_FICCA|nr:hypothetical protein TIFTF001_028729 [Ficus carica]